MVWARPTTIAPLAGRQRQHPSARGLLVRPKRHALFLWAWRPPGRAALRQALASTCLRTPHALRGRPGGMRQPQVGSPRAPGGLRIVGPARRPGPPLPLSWSQRRPVAAATASPGVAWRGAARGAPRPRVRPPP